MQTREEWRSPSYVRRWGRTFLAKGTACTKTLRQAITGLIRGNSWRLVCLEEMSSEQWDGENRARCTGLCGFYSDCSGRLRMGFSRPVAWSCLWICPWLLCGEWTEEANIDVGERWGHWVVQGVYCHWTGPRWWHWSQWGDDELGHVRRQSQ